MGVRKLLVAVRSWLQSNDDVWLSDAFREQWGRDKLHYYTHVGDPSNA